MKKSLELFIESFDSSVPEKRKIENKYYVAYSIKDLQVVYTEIGNDIPDNELWYWTTDSNPVQGILECEGECEILPYTDHGTIRFSAPIKSLNIYYYVITTNGAWGKQMFNLDDNRRITRFLFPKTLNSLSLDSGGFDNLSLLVFHPQSTVIADGLYPLSIKDIKNAQTVSLAFNYRRMNSLVGSEWYNKQNDGPVYLNPHTLVGFKGVADNAIVHINSDVTYVGSYWYNNGNFKKIVWDIPTYKNFTGHWSYNGTTSVSGESVFWEANFSLEEMRFWSNDVASIDEFQFGESVERIPAYLFGSTFVSYDSILASSFVSIKDVKIGSNVKSIGEGGIGNVETLTCMPVVPPVIDQTYLEGDYSPFGVIDKIYVPAQSVEAYKVAEGWKWYADKIYPIAD